MKRHIIKDPFLDLEDKVFMFERHISSDMDNEEKPWCSIRIEVDACEINSF